MSVLENVDLEALLKRLHLANARRIYRDLIERAEKEQWSFHDFLCVLAAEEVAHRQQTRIQRLTHRARFPFLKTIDDFDFTYQSTLRLSLLGSALSPDFVHRVYRCPRRPCSLRSQRRPRFFAVFRGLLAVSSRD